MLRRAVIAFIMTFVLMVLGTNNAGASPPSNAKAKFYDFSDQLINGEVKKPANLYLDARKKVKFDRLLKLKKSFLPELMKTAKDPVFR